MEAEFVFTVIFLVGVGKRFGLILLYPLHIAGQTAWMERCTRRVRHCFEKMVLFYFIKMFYFIVTRFFSSIVLLPPPTPPNPTTLLVGWVAE